MHFSWISIPKNGNWLINLFNYHSLYRLCFACFTN
jgi:hypothetical protein